MKIQIKKQSEELNWIDILILKAVSDGLPISISKLYGNGFLNSSNNLTLKGREIVNSIEIEGVENTTKKQNEETLDFESFIDLYRSKFKGKKLGAIGDKQALVEKMNRFIKSNDYTYEHMLNAIQLYINEQASSSYKYLTKAHYTVYKKTDKEEVSILATYCEELNPGTKIQDFQTNSTDSGYEFI
jgi:hypothetical protein